MSPAKYDPETPQLGSVTKLDGTPGSVLNNYDYPLLAVCISHNRAIRTESYHSDWLHIDGEPATIRDIAAGMELRSMQHELRGGIMQRPVKAGILAGLCVVPLGVVSPALAIIGVTGVLVWTARKHAFAVSMLIAALMTVGIVAIGFFVADWAYTQWWISQHCTLVLGTRVCQ